MFISIEGIEGTGKSTLAATLVNHLQNSKQVVLTREPGGTPIAESIRKLILHDHPDEKILPKAELLLMFASRIQHIETIIKPALNKGCWVISDRFVDASFAYQGGGRGLNSQQISSISKFALDDFKPDLTLLLDLDVKSAEIRIANKNKDKIEQEDSLFFQQVREAYLARAKSDPKRIKVISAKLSPKNIFDQAIHHIKELTNEL